MGVEKRQQQTVGGEWEGKLGLVIGRDSPNGIQLEGHSQLAQIKAHSVEESQARGQREEERGNNGRDGTGVRGSRVKYGDITSKIW